MAIHFVQDFGLIFIFIFSKPVSHEKNSADEMVYSH